MSPNDDASPVKHYYGCYGVIYGVTKVQPYGSTLGNEPRNNKKKENGGPKPPILTQSNQTHSNLLNTPTQSIPTQPTL
jgi:hypothetical protein